MSEKKTMNVIFLAIQSTDPQSMVGSAAVAMMFVVADELLPGSHNGEHSNAATLMFLFGFVLMMVLDNVFA